MSRVREHWSSKVGFIFAAIGSAVGLGVLWKFPYTVGKNGGGFFILAYLCCTLAIGIPVLIGELMMGRRAQAAAVNTFGHLAPDKPFWKVAGWFGVISSFLIMSFYSVIAGYGMSYIAMSLMGAFKGLDIAQVKEKFEVLAGSADVALLWHFVFTLITMCIVFSGVRKGIEFWSKLMTRGLFVMLLILFFYSIRLSGFGHAAHFVFYPDWSRFSVSSLLEALGLAFFTLSLGQGIMFSYGSYLDKETDIPQMSLIISFAVILVGILAAMVVFPIVFTFGMEPAAGNGLIFQTLPYLFAQLPGAVIVSTLFFILFVFTAITSSVAFIEVIATNLMELVGWERKKSVVLVAAATFIVGIPSACSYSGTVFAPWQSIYGQNFLDTIDNLVSVWLIPVGGLLTAVFIGWVFNKKDAEEAFRQGTIFAPLFLLWHFCMRYIVPILILFIIFEKSGLV
ncbi:MAG: hypothetical protein S4CHLAM102_14240 [Chlamydiia bacterium]|nr:hypothetical protein [Chlamydiia bacterium]